ncbi:MAG: 50S ribosomal protein L9 [Planctomycetota bacterium]|nr:MAG: 50S ribosomal protein L9 [Planctomycetota bacterium]
MKLLLRRDIPKLGLVGDVVEVKEGYARTYLIPQHLAVEPTPANMKKIEEDKRKVEEERERSRMALEERATRLRDVEVTISAACNPDGQLYGSVGPREIASALRDEGHEVEAKQVQLHESIRRLDTVTVPVTFADDLTVEVKVWVVRETGIGDLEEEEPSPDLSQESAGKEAGQDERGTGADPVETDIQ